MFSRGKTGDSCTCSVPFRLDGFLRLLTMSTTPETIASMITAMQIGAAIVTRLDETEFGDAAVVCDDDNEIVDDEFDTVTDDDDRVVDAVETLLLF